MRWLWLGLLIFSSSAMADWQIAAPSVRLTTLAGARAWSGDISDDQAQAKLVLAAFDPATYEFEVFAPERGAADSAATAAKQLKAVAAINGGYFQASGTPVGLLISEGKVRHRFERARLLSGAFMLRAGKTPQIVRCGQIGSLSDVRGAVQSGPFLVEFAQPVADLEATRSAARSFVFATADHRLGLGICRSVTLAQLADLLVSVEISRTWHIVTALNLDGGSSTDLFLRLGQSDFSSSGWTGVPNYLLVRQKGGG
jgi:exopolysaccharide biosynthesis protein